MVAKHTPPVLPAGLQYIRVDLPHRALFPGETFHVNVYSRTKHGLETVLGSISTHPLLLIKRVDYSTDATPAWENSNGKVMQTAQGGFSVLNGKRLGVLKDRIGQPVLLCTVTLTVSLSVTTGMALKFDVVLQGATDAHRQAVRTTGAVVVDARNGFTQTTTGFVYARADAPAALFITPASAELANTAALDGRTVLSKLTVRAVSARGGGFVPVSGAGLTCRSNASDILAVDGLCAHVSLSAAQQGGAAAVQVTATYKTLTAAQAFAVWFPSLPANVTTARTTLHRIAGWTQPKNRSGCGGAGNRDGATKPVYQSTQVFVRTTFTTGVPTTAYAADVTSLVSLHAVDAAVAAPGMRQHASGVPMTIIQGRSVGVTTITARFKTGNRELGVSTGIRVSDVPVEVVRLHAVVVRSLAVVARDQPHAAGPSISNSKIAPLFVKMAQNLDLRCVSVPAPWVLAPKHVSNPE